MLYYLKNIDIFFRYIFYIGIAVGGDNVSFIQLIYSNAPIHKKMI